MAAPTASCRCGCFEFGTVYRNEKSGVVQGLTRVRSITQDDSHSYCTPEQAPDEVRHLLRFVLSLLKDFGLTDVALELSTRDEVGKKKDKFIGSDEQWEAATKSWPKSPTKSGLVVVDDPGGAAYYGPKISNSGQGRHRTHLADVDIQYDFNQPERFGWNTSPPMAAIAAVDDSLGQVRFDRTVHGCAHRALCGCLPGLAGSGAGRRHSVAASFNDYLAGVLDKLRAAGVRTELDASDDRMQKKIRNAPKQKIPFMLIGRRRDRRRGRFGLTSVSATVRNATVCPSTRRSPSSATGHNLAATTIRRPRQTVNDEQPARSSNRGSYPASPTRCNGCGAYRMVYIQGSSKPPMAPQASAPFCRAPERSDEESLIVHRDAPRM